jgi:flagellar hook-associated protein 3 FlgL
MNVSGTSDLAQLGMLQRQAVSTRTALDRAASELTTGQKADRFKATGGNMTRLFAMERALERNAVFTETITLSELRLDVMQEGLGRILGPVESISVDLSVAVSQGNVAQARMHARAARGAFADAVSALNSQVGGQSLFAGTRTGGPALAAAEGILADLDALAAGTTTAAGAMAAINDYFDAGSGSVPNFHGDGYVGSVDDLGAVEIGDGRRINAGLRADQEELVAVLKAQALAAVVANGSFGGNEAGEMALLGEAGAQMLAAKEGLLDFRSRVGASQYAVEQARAGRVSERETLDLARAELLAADPYEAASSYQQLQSQLEALYTVTSRLAGLRFSNFM